MSEQNQAVTTVVRHHIKPGRMETFEAWSKRIREASKSFDGFVGSELIRPVDPPKAGEHCTATHIFRFASVDQLEVWMTSEKRQRLLSETNTFCAAAPEYNRFESLEFMFPMSDAGRPPSRPKMALVTFTGLIAPVYFIPPLIAEHVTSQPLLVTLTSLAVIVPTMVYAIMPALTKLVKPWLHN